MLRQDRRFHKSIHKFLLLSLWTESSDAPQHFEILSPKTRGSISFFHVVTSSWVVQNAEVESHDSIHNSCSSLRPPPMHLCSKTQECGSKTYRRWDGLAPTMPRVSAYKGGSWRWRF
jgi:hypothetical protein